MKIIVVGDEDTVLGFRLIGIEGVVVSGSEEASRALRETIARKDAGIVLITEKTADSIRDEVDARVVGSGLPLVLEIPDASGAAPDRAGIEDIVKRAIGIGL